jgi:Zn-dependent protease with chaperone function
VTELLKVLALGLVWFLAVNAAASVLTLAVSRFAPGPRDSMPPARRARALFALRLFPAGASTLAILLYFLPAYLAHEPLGSGETVGLPLLGVAFLAGALLAAAAGRGLRSWQETRWLARALAQGAEPVSLPGVGLPAYRIRHPFPVVTVLGVHRPRLYVAEQVLSGLDEAERTAVFDHELAHVISRDNLRYWLMRACPDLLVLFPAGEALTRSWLTATEEAADEAATRRTPRAALDLADALVKVARLVPRGQPALVPALALHNGDDIARRVGRLLQGSPSTEEPRRTGWALAGLVLLAAAPPLCPSSLRFVHELTERLLALLG